MSLKARTSLTIIDFREGEISFKKKKLPVQHLSVLLSYFQLVDWLLEVTNGLRESTGIAVDMGIVIELCMESVQSLYLALNLKERVA